MNKLVLVLLSLSLYAFGCSAIPDQALVKQAPTTPTVQLPEDLLLLRQIEPAMKVKTHYNIPAGTRLAIVPHHLVAMREIVSLLDSWPDPKPKRIFLISPDHFSQGKTAFTSLKEDYLYKDKRVSNDADSVDFLKQHVPAISLEPRIVQREHGIDALVPLFDRTMPGTKIIPITIRIDAKDDELASLVNALQTELNEPDTAVIGSIDMSHYLPEVFADLHDARTIDLMKTLATDQTKSMEIDSPGSMFVILDLARRLDLGDVRIQAHTNSLRILETKMEDGGTSHILTTFSPGKAPSQRTNQTTLFAPPGIPSEENRLYYGQDEIRSPLSDHPNITISAIINTDGTHSIEITPLIKSGKTYQIMPRDQRLPLVETWKQNGTWDAIVKELEKQL